MEADPWGSAPVDPWTKQPDATETDVIPDPLQVPKEFTMERRTSATADPWGATEDDGSEEQTIEPALMPAGTMQEREPPPSLAWGAETTDDGWGPVKDQDTQQESTMRMPTNLDRDDNYSYPVVDENAGFGDEEPYGYGQPQASAPSSPITSANDEEENPIPPLEAVSEEPVGDPGAFDNLPEDEYGFSSGPFPSTTVLPTFKTSLPESPAFEDDGFGGFSGGFDDAAPMPEWGPTHKDDDDGWGSPTFGSPVVPTQSQAPVDAWGNEEASDPDEPIADVAPTARETQEDEWDRARKAIQRREAAAPTELVAKLEREWKQLARECYGTKPSNGTTHIDEDAGLEREDLEARERLMHELGNLPPELDTFQNNLAMSMTWARYQDALSQVNLDTRSSVLALVSRQSATRAARRSSTEWQQEFRSKNRPDESLAQKEAQTDAQAEEARSKWSFWGRRQSTQAVPLTTSGGGALEVKALSPHNTGNASIKTNASTPFNAPSPLSAGTAGFALSPIAGSSVPSSVAPLAMQTITPTDPPQEASAEPPSGAVGRFFGRFRKPRTSTASADLSNQDLELTKGDLTFLDQVPTAPMVSSSAGPGHTDLLSLGVVQGQNEEMAGLESMLKSKPVALPSRLAPPPLSKRSSSAASIPKLGASSRSRSHVDMFGDLDLSTPSPPTTQARARSATPSNGLFELMTSGNSTPNVAQAVSTAPTFDFFDTPALAGPSRLPATAMPAATPPFLDSSPRPVPAKTTIDENDGFGDFGDFSDQNGGGFPMATGAKASSFDDFGDFDSFETPTPVTSQPAATAPAGLTNGDFFAGISKPNTSRLTDLNFGFAQPVPNTAAEDLVRKASQRQGRWPAPPSPIPDALSPPPGGDFFSSNTSMPSGPTNVQMDFGSLAPISSVQRNNSPSPNFPAMTSKNPAAVGLSAKDKRATLSAQDLSFFDTL